MTTDNARLTGLFKSVVVGTAPNGETIYGLMSVSGDGSGNPNDAAHPSYAALAAGENHIGAVGGHIARVSASFTRPADTTAYASGDLVANNTVANSVTPMAFAIGRDALGKGGMIRRARLRKSGTGITNALFRLHLYSVSPVQTGGASANTGDNAAWSTDGAANYVGAIDITVDKAFTDGAAGNGVPIVGSEINFTADTYYGLLEARGSYMPANGETFNLLLEVHQN